jgi:hypothetical protein
VSAAVVRIALVALLIGVPKGPEAGVIRSVTDPESAVTLSAPRRSVSGQATWYRWRPREAAAGPALRRALGNWRGRVVTVCRIERTAAVCAKVTLTDFMRADRLVDLDLHTFTLFAPRERGVVKVTVTW